MVEVASASRGESLLCVEWGVAQLALAGQSVSGDRAVVAAFPGGILAGAIDGLGHGPDAADAAALAAEELEAAPEKEIEALLSRCHDRLQGSRGAVISLASIDCGASTMTWGAIGNVEGVVLHDSRAMVHLVQQAGIVGQRVMPIRSTGIPLEQGDTVVLATDGIRGAFASSIGVGDPQNIADTILEQHSRGTDDALVLVVRFRGPMN
ncbi:MAG: SpoIIE family protein phosphatase [Actinomycetota bacterium]